MRNKIEIKFGGLIKINHIKGFSVIFFTSEQNLNITLFISELESIYIKSFLDKKKLPRPLTHDLFKNFADTFGIECKKVVIYKFNNGIYYSKITFTDGANTYEIDSRTSDAVALGLRFNCKFYIYDNLLQDTGIETQAFNKLYKPLVSMNKTFVEDIAPINLSDIKDINKLNSLLKDSIKNEDYEQAAIIRDLINKKSKQQLYE